MPRLAPPLGALPVTLLLAACAPPSEPLTRVVADAPLLAEARADAPVVTVLHAGDLVRVGKTVAPALSWSGTVEGSSTSLDGEVVEVQRPGEGSGVMFRSQLGAVVPAFSADYVCRRLRAGADCAGRLRRLALDDEGTTFAFLPCGGEGCPAALLRGRRMSTATIDWIADARTAVVDGQTLVLADAVIRHHLAWTERKTHVFKTGEGLERAFTIDVSETDTRTPRNHFIEGGITIGSDEITYRGRDRFTAANQGNAVLSDHPIVQHYRLAPKPR